jgi:uncharacterized protein YbaR (Trm112 family)
VKSHIQSIDRTSYLSCPACHTRFVADNKSARMLAHEHGSLQCVNGHSFAIKNSVPNLLAPRYSKIIKTLTAQDARPASPRDVESATAWLSDVLAMDLSTSRVSPGDRALRRLLSQLAKLLDGAGAEGLSDDDVREVCSILSSEAMSPGYRRHVADPARASMEAVNYEKYEDILLRNVLNDCLAGGENVAMIELGSGPGRLLHQYGSTLSQDDKACVLYRRLGPQLYLPSSLPEGSGLKLLLGVDFAQDMLESAARWFRQDRLGDLVEKGTISQVRATVRDLPVAFGAEWDGTTRVACILFQTLGNQIGRTLQLEMLRVAREVIGKRGVVFLSVFNAESFAEQGASYYGSIKGSVGVPWAWGSRSFLSKRGVYSQWFHPAEVRSLFEDAGMSSAQILDERALRVFPEYESYIDTRSQERYKRRALIGVYACGVDIDVSQ